VLVEVRPYEADGDFLYKASEGNNEPKDAIHCNEKLRKGIVDRIYDYDDARIEAIVMEDEVRCEDGLEPLPGSMECLEALYASGHAGIKDIEINLENPGVATAAAGTINNTEEWIIDSGATNHMIALDSLDPGAAARTVPASEPIHTLTANGVVIVDKRIEVEVPDLDISVNPLVFQSTPPALSMGTLCEEGPYDFIWMNKSGKPLLRNAETGRRPHKYIKGQR